MENVQVAPPLQCSIALEDNPRQRLPFESFPFNINEAYTAEYDTKALKGRASQSIRAFYKGGDYSEFSIELKFVAGLISQPGKTQQDRTSRQNITTSSREQKIAQASALELELQKMEAKVRWLQATAFPKPDIPRTEEQKRFMVKGDPPVVLIALGSFMTIRGVVSSCDITWNAPFHKDSVRPYSAEVGLRVQRLAEFYPDWYDISGVLIKQSPLNYALGGLGDSTTQDILAQVDTSPRVVTSSITGTIGVV